MQGMAKNSAPSNNFAKALKATRIAKGLSQEEFDLVSSRTYVSSLERGLKSPTLGKIDDLAKTMGVHPLTLVAMAYLKDSGSAPIFELMTKVAGEIEAILNG
jgi:transcriptional regulator with XRE-family HTH domain